MIDIVFSYKDRNKFQQIGQSRVAKLKQLEYRLKEAGIEKDDSSEYQHLFIRNAMSAVARVQSALYTRQASSKTGCRYIMKEMQDILMKARDIDWNSVKLQAIVLVRNRYAHDDYTDIEELYEKIKDCSEIIEYLILHADSNVNSRENRIAIRIEMNFR